MTAPKPAPHRATRPARLYPGTPMIPVPGAGAPKPKPRRSTRPVRAFPGFPMVPVGGHARLPGHARHGRGRHGLAQPGMLPLCASLAVAESLLAATGTAAGEDDLLRLHEVAGGTAEGASLAGVLGALEREGLAGIRPLSVAEVFPGEGTIVSLRLELAQEAQQEWAPEPSPFWGLHAVFLTEGNALTWGRAVPVTEAFVERQALAAWQITWPDKRGEGSVWP